MAGTNRKTFILEIFFRNERIMLMFKSKYKDHGYLYLQYKKLELYLMNTSN